MGSFYSMRFLLSLASRTAVLRSSRFISINSVCHVNITPHPNVLMTPYLTFCQRRNLAKQSQGKKSTREAKGGKSKMMHLSMEELSQVINVEGYQNELDTVGEKLKKDFIENLSLRSTANNVHNLMIKIENEEYPLHELAQISRKNPNLIAINMVDFPEGLKPAIQAIIDSGSGLNPQQEGTMIYLNVPKLTREHRENLAKNAKALFIKAKEEIRAIQNYYVKDAKGKTDLSEDLVFSTTNQVMAMADQTASELEKVLKTKQKELLNEN